MRQKLASRIMKPNCGINNRSKFWNVTKFLVISKEHDILQYGLKHGLTNRRKENDREHMGRDS